MPPSLLASQYESLQTLGDDERGVTVDISDPPHAMVDHILAYLSESTIHAH